MLNIYFSTESSFLCFLIGQYSAKLLKKPDQCRAVYACSHLFWVDDHDNMKDGERFVSIDMTSVRFLTSMECLFLCSAMLVRLFWVFCGYCLVEQKYW